MTGIAWRRLPCGTEPTTASVLLTVDFGPRTGQRGFSRFAERLALPYAVYETVPRKVSGASLTAGTRPDGYVRHWTGDLPGGEVRGIVTFCSGARFAGALAEACGQPPVVLLDPSDITGESLRAEFDVTVEPLRQQVGDVAVESARRAAVAIVAAGRDLAATAEALCAEHRHLVEAALPAAPRHLVDGLCDRFATYLGYLAASGRAEVAQAVQPALVVASADHPLPGRYRPAALVLDLPHERMLDDDTVAGLVRDGLAATAVGGGGAR
jgi:hypothetical protein